MWTQLFSILTAIVSIFIILKKFPSDSRDIIYPGIVALSTWLLGDIVLSLDIPFQKVMQLLLQSVSLSLVLVIFLKFIRQRKPIIFRYPTYMVYLPLLIPFTQLIVADTQFIGEIIFMSLQAICIVVYILLSIGYSDEIQNKILTIVGVLLLLWGFMFYWILQEYYIVFEWAWGLTNAAGLIASVYSFSNLIGVNQKNLKSE